ncbi:hypothetical protein P9112_013264 [Eukaryota sp. TZLM1-RC]
MVSSLSVLEHNSKVFIGATLKHDRRFFIRNADLTHFDNIQCPSNTIGGVALSDSFVSFSSSSLSIVNPLNNSFTTRSVAIPPLSKFSNIGRSSVGLGCHLDGSLCFYG